MTDEIETFVPQFDEWPQEWPDWTRQYENTARHMHRLGHYEVADDLATLVQGLVDAERELTE